MTGNLHHSHQLYTKLSCTPPKVIKKPLLLANYVKICQPFSILHTGKWHSQNLHQIAQNSHNSPAFGSNHVKFAQSVPISQSSLHTIVKLSKFMTFAHFSILTNSAHFAQMEINPGWSELSKIRTILFLCIFMKAHVRLAPNPA